MNGQVTPSYDNTVRGGSLGLTLAHDRPSMVRAVLEGTAYELRMVVQALEKVLGRPFSTLRLTGGGAKSAFWIQIQADVYGKPIQTLQNSECTTLGAAILGGVGAGVFNNIEEAVHTLVRVGPTIEPDESRHKVYDELYSIFCDAFRSLRANRIYERLAQLQDRI